MSGRVARSQRTHAVTMLVDEKTFAYIRNIRALSATGQEVSFDLLDVEVGGHKPRPHRFWTNVVSMSEPASTGEPEA